MLVYNRAETARKNINGGEVYCFNQEGGNIDARTVESFGEEWQKFDKFTDEEIKLAGDQYFDIVDENMLNKNATVLDLGCGSGRWTKYMVNNAKFIEAVDPSNAIFRTAELYPDLSNVRFTQASIDTLPFDDNAFDFIISLGVLHHIPDTSKAISSLISKLKPGGYALIYLYYALDNRALSYKLIFRLSSIFRWLISSFPQYLKQLACDIIALVVYLPLVFLARTIKSIGMTKLYKKLPLSYYVGKSWNIIRNDALDRFGTPLEQRFSREEIKQMLNDAGLSNIRFSPNEPYWHVTAQKIEDNEH